MATVDVDASKKNDIKNVHSQRELYNSVVTFYIEDCVMVEVVFSIMICTCVRIYGIGYV
jgi:hypothetical protein